MTRAHAIAFAVVGALLLLGALLVWLGSEGERPAAVSDTHLRNVAILAHARTEAALAWQELGR